MRAGGWERGVWATSYLARLPRLYMRVAAGFGSAAGSYYLKRGQEQAPVALTKMIWPWVDGALAEYADGHVPNPDTAGRHFLELLVRLRQVFLQDAAILQAEFPSSRLWRHAVFSDPAWPAFAAKVRDLEAAGEDPAHVAIGRVLPDVANSLVAMGNKINTVQAKQDRALAVLGQLDQARVGPPVEAAAVAAVTRLEQAVMPQLAQMQLRLQSQLLQSQPRPMATVPLEAIRPDWLVSQSRGSGASPTPPGFSFLPPPVTASTTATAAAPPGAPPPPPPSNLGSISTSTQLPSGCPLEGVSPHVGTAQETIREFYVGSWKDGMRTPSMVELDRQWGARWRHTSTLKQRYYVKRNMVRGIEKLAAERGETTEEVAVALDRLGLSGSQIAVALQRGRDLLGARETA